MQKTIVDEDSIQISNKNIEENQAKTVTESDDREEGISIEEDKGSEQRTSVGQKNEALPMLPNTSSTLEGDMVQMAMVNQSKEQSLQHINNADALDSATASIN